VSTFPQQSVFLALADPTRRLIIQRLAFEETVTATRLAADLSISRQAVSKHLETLVQAGLLASQVQGRERQYQLRPEPLQEVANWITQIEAQWDAKLQALHRYLLQQESALQENGESDSSC
jgi:DNA-binding transcriptional ArsR family regulator